MAKKIQIQEPSETEIINFAYDFVNLINQKNADIRELKNEIKKLQEQIRMINSVELTKEEVRCTSCPVWVVTKSRFKDGFYALPITGGVKTAKGGIYRLDKYNETWVAYSTRPSSDIDK